MKDSRIFLVSTADNRIEAPPGCKELHAPAAVNGAALFAKGSARFYLDEPGLRGLRGALDHNLTREAPDAPFFEWGATREELEAALRGGARVPTPRVLGLWRKHSVEAAAQRADREKWEREQGERRCGDCKATTPGGRGWSRYKGTGPWLCNICRRRKTQ